MHPMYFAVGTQSAELIKVNQSTKQVFISNDLMMINQNLVQLNDASLLWVAARVLFISC